MRFHAILPSNSSKAHRAAQAGRHECVVSPDYSLPFRSCSIDPIACACGRQDVDGIRRGIIKNALTTSPRLYGKDRGQSRQLCRELGARQADRTRRAGHLHVRRHRLDGLRDPEENYQTTRINLLGNSIVLIAPKASVIDIVTIEPGFDLAKLVGNGKIATGDVTSVPVGKYAKSALEKLGAWSAVEPKFAMAENVRAALLLVARDEAALGIVYATDAKVEPGVKIVGTFTANSHPPIIYPVAATTTAKAEAADYLAFLRMSASKGSLEKYGFTFLIKPTS
jgi:molybdenum ABC transporter molybdate-binding protein